MANVFFMKNYKSKEITKQGFEYSQIKIFVVALFVLFSSCDSFLEVTPEGQIDAGAFFSNPDELLFALNGVYASQRGLYSDFSYYNLTESRSDNTTMDQTDQKERVEIDTFEETPGNLLLVGVWTRHYVLINNANTVIARASTIPAETSSDQDLITRAVAEAKFLRAMTYFSLANMCGGLPLRTEPTTDFDNAVLERSSLDATYDLIIQDLTAAAAALPTSYDGGVFNEVGRATRYAAYALLGKVQLQKGNASAASTALQEVVGNYSLLPNYSSIYAAGNDNTAESVYEVNFNPTNQTGLGFNNSFIPASEASRLGIVSGGAGGKIHTFPTADLMGTYETGDLRAASFATYDGGNSTHYISKFIDLEAAGDGSDINLIPIRYADVLLMKAEADGESAASYELINKVRRRAFGGDSDVPDPTVDLDVSSSGTFLGKVMLERRRELAFEGQRWLDLKRLPESDALAILNSHMAAEYTGVPTVKSNGFLYPIPQQEIDVSGGVITQNPGFN